MVSPYMRNSYIFFFLSSTLSLYITVVIEGTRNKRFGRKRHIGINNLGEKCWKYKEMSITNTHICTASARYDVYI